MCLYAQNREKVLLRQVQVCTFAPFAVMHVFLKVLNCVFHFSLIARVILHVNLQQLLHGNNEDVSPVRQSRPLSYIAISKKVVLQKP